MKLTTRDKWMCAVLPALIGGIIYQQFYQRPRRAEIDGLKKQIQTQGPPAARQAAAKMAETERAQLERAVDAARAPGAKAGAFNRTAALQQLSKLCESGELTLISTTPDAGSKLPPSIEQAAKVLIKPGDPNAPQVWRLELRGSYSAMVGLLDGITAAPTLMVPLGLGMQPDALENRPLNWTLILWL